MYKIKKGDVVGRISYGKDILFTVEKIVNKADGKKVAILKGIIIRIEADANLEDLVVMRKRQIQTNMRNLEHKLEDRIRKCTNTGKKKNIIVKQKNLGRSFEEVNGRILHLDGDRRYSDKSIKYYKKLGLNAIVRNIPENRQEYVVMDLLNRYRPDILVITGHDRNDKTWNRL